MHFKLYFWWFFLNCILFNRNCVRNCADDIWIWKWRSKNAESSQKEKVNQLRFLVSANLLQSRESERKARESKKSKSVNLIKLNSGESKWNDSFFFSFLVSWFFSSFFIWLCSVCMRIQKIKIKMMLLISFFFFLSFFFQILLFEVPFFLSLTLFRLQIK